jgi:hypothetical protein
MPMRLHAVAHEDDQRQPLPDGARGVVFRDLVAIVTEAPFVAHEADEALVTMHARVVAAAFERGELLPVPPGTAFRDDTSLQRWMELHYVPLSDALAFVADRVGARVHVTGVDRDGAAGDAGNDLASAAAELMRTLRRRAVAAVPLAREHTTGIAIGVSFLVERTLWHEFEEEVAAVAHDPATTRVTMTGPWPPYDFVHIELGS